MAKLLNQLEYSKLVVLIYSISDYNKEKATILYNYTAYHLLKNQFNEMYLDKLALDLRLLNTEETDIIKYVKDHSEYKRNLKLMDERFNKFELIKIKATVFNILQHGYYK